MAKSAPKDAALKTTLPPFETVELRKGLTKFFSQPIGGHDGLTIGKCKWGVYAFYDYDREPIYVGQTKESLSSRVGRHLTNRRTDAVAMSVLDPFEVHSIAVWPIPGNQHIVKSSHPEYGRALAELNELEAAVCKLCVEKSKFGAILNEKIPEATGEVALPKEYSGVIITEDVQKLRDHPDIRLARRASTIARLALIISERTVQAGLRRTLKVQADRLQWLADERLSVFAKEVDKEDKTAGSADEEGDTQETEEG